MLSQQIVLPATMVKLGHVTDITPSCPHLDGTWRDGKPVADSHHDSHPDKGRGLGRNGVGHSRILAGLHNLTNGLPEEIRGVCQPLSLKELYRKAKK